MDPEQRRGLQAAIVAYVMWGMLTLYWKELADFDPVELVGWRVSTAGLVMTAGLVLTGRFANLRLLLDPSTLASVVAASLLLTVNWSTYVWAVSNDHVIDTALGYFLAPLGTMAVGVFLLGERLTPLKRVSIGCAVAAVIVLVVSYGAIPWVALLLAVSWTSYGFVKRRVALDPVTSLTGELLVLIVPAVAIVIVRFESADGVPREASDVELLLVLGTGIITAAPLLLFAFAAKRVPFTILGPANYLIPVTNFLLGWLIFDEALPPSRVVGFLLVWCALIFATLDMVRGDNTAGIAAPDVRTSDLSADATGGKSDAQDHGLARLFGAARSGMRR
ncbi:MAG TPA: EamA family transporter RarD [Ilumatobacter sp.]|nr:EamA family transporter RarD [Ilumatobacter sp.]